MNSSAGAVDTVEFMASSFLSARSISRPGRSRVESPVSPVGCLVIVARACGSCAAAARSASGSTGCSGTSVRAPARCSCCAARRGSARPSLLEYVAEHATGCRLARAAGVQSEMELAFAALHQLCAPLLEGLGTLPRPQRDALEVAFGLREGEPPNRFLVAVASLGLLAEAAESRPLVCLIDDAQWLDRASAQVLAFVARRLLAEPIAMVFAVREPAGEDLIDLPELRRRGPDRRRGPRAARVGRCPGGSTSACATGSSPRRAATRSRCRSCRARVTAAQLAGGFGLPDARPLAGRIEQSFLERVQRASRGHAAAAPARRGRPARRRGAAAARGPAARDRRRGRPSGRGRRPARARPARGVPAPARALRRLPRREPSRAPRGPPRAGGGDRPRARSRPPRLAPRTGRGRSRRVRRRRDGRLRRPRPAPRRPRGRRRVPAAGDRADARPGRCAANAPWPPPRPSSTSPTR